MFGDIGNFGFELDYDQVILYEEDINASLFKLLL